MIEIGERVDEEEERTSPSPPNECSIQDLELILNSAKAMIKTTTECDSDEERSSVCM